MDLDAVRWTRSARGTWLDPCRAARRESLIRRVGVLLGAAFMQVFRNGLVLLGFHAYWQSASIGALILVALLLDYWRQRVSEG